MMILRLAWCLAAAAAQEAGRRWAPADELLKLHGNTLPTDAKARVDAELKRSVQQIRRRETVEDVTNLIKGLLSPKHRDRAAFLLDGRMYLGSTALPFSSKPFYTREKPRKAKLEGLAVMLAAAQRRGVTLPNAAWVPDMGSSTSDRRSCSGDEPFPTTVIAKKYGYAACGILIPNPYFGMTHKTRQGELDAWERHRKAVRGAGASKRKPQAFWRGKCMNHEDRATGDAVAKRDKNSRNRGGEGAHAHKCVGCCSPQDDADKDSGNRARLLGAALSAKRPDLFDVRCSQIVDPPRNHTCVHTKERALLDEASSLVARYPDQVSTQEWSDALDYASYKYVLNLPSRSGVLKCATENRFRYAIEQASHRWRTRGIRHRRLSHAGARPAAATRAT